MATLLFLTFGLFALKTVLLSVENAESPVLLFMHALPLLGGIAEEALRRSSGASYRNEG
jgi:hypothetical protein